MFLKNPSTYVMIRKISKTLKDLNDAIDNRKKLSPELGQTIVTVLRENVLALVYVDANLYYNLSGVIGVLSFEVDQGVGIDFSKYENRIMLEKEIETLHLQIMNTLNSVDIPQNQEHYVNP